MEVGILKDVLSRLPTEILCEIFGFIPLTDLKSVLLSSKFLSKVILESHILRDYIVRIHPKFDISKYVSEPDEQKTNWGRLLTELSTLRKYHKREIAKTTRTEVPKKSIWMRAYNPEDFEEDCEKATIVRNTVNISNLYLIYCPKTTKMLFYMKDCQQSEKGYEGVDDSIWSFHNDIGSDVEHVGDFFWKEKSLADLHFKFLSYGVWYDRGGGGSGPINLDLMIENVKFKGDDDEMTITNEMIVKIFKESDDKCSCCDYHTQKRSDAVITCPRVDPEVKNMNGFLENVKKEGSSINKFISENYNSQE